MTRLWYRLSPLLLAFLAILVGLALGLAFGLLQLAVLPPAPGAVVSGQDPAIVVLVEMAKGAAVALALWFLVHRLSVRRVQRIQARLRRIAGTDGMPSLPPGLDQLSQLEAGAVLLLRGLRRRMVQATNRERMIDLLVEVVPDGILVLRADQSIVRVNRAGAALFGYADADLIGKPLEILLPERLRARHRGLIDALVASGVGSVMMAPDRVVSGRRQDGSEFPIAVSIGKTRLRGEFILIAIARDLSALERARTNAEQVAAAAQAAARQATLADRSKSEFLASMSHELRTPLSGIIGFAEMMQLETFGPLGHPKYREYVDDIHVSGEHLLALLGDILDVSRLDLDLVSVTPAAQPTDLSPLVHAALRSLGEQVAATLILEAVGFDRPRMVMASERSLRQILLNLVANACRFADQANGQANGIVSIRAIDGSDGLTGFEVRDNGPGFSQGVLDRFGTPFNTDEDSTVHKARAGTGLGLYISKRIVEGLDGRISLYNGEGAVACVLFRPAGEGSGQ